MPRRQTLMRALQRVCPVCTTRGCIPVHITRQFKLHNIPRQEMFSVALHSALFGLTFHEIIIPTSSGDTGARLFKTASFEISFPSSDGRPDDDREVRARSLVVAVLRFVTHKSGIARTGGEGQHFAPTGRRGSARIQISAVKTFGRNAGKSVSQNVRSGGLRTGSNKCEFRMLANACSLVSWP